MMAQQMVQQQSVNVIQNQDERVKVYHKRNGGVSSSAIVPWKL